MIIEQISSQVFSPILISVRDTYG